ncbi:carboxylesterase/lipase family protein [Paenibacillus cellulositrophicus]|uniref:carboxylesterase/lipase family protein n=1 Tax=Paenibacillus cellulositrophicus TaxID=562959 RepID=UPI00204144EA|nr:carboxylesterase/lipase family protein [Paenibacillus cellulositrophicus]MCM2997911.1 carboxylesterase/lipase family protein [Paenibacillus cellulositrophicus]
MKLDQLLIRTHNGLIQGYVQNGVRTWKAIPYAEPPVGERRFRKPLPARPWAGVRSGDMTVPLAPQRVNPTGGAFRLKRDQIPQSEDCLYVNVWAPDEPAPQPLPVMVWIHGGAFVTGGGGLPIYDGSELARRGGLIVVSLSYRLGPLGFTHFSPFSGESEDGYVSNAGLLDQIEALRWVKHNIAAFGGDPQQVTVFGESAGSMSIAALLAMPAAQGLFTRAIMQSGASQAISDSHGRLLTKGLLDILGIPEDQLERLQEVPAEEILRAADELKQAAGASAVMLFQPVVDGKLLPVTPLEAVAAGSAAGIEIIIGTNRDEGALFIPEGMPMLTKEQNARAYTAVTGSKEAASWIEAYPATVEGQRQAMTELFFWRSALQFAEAQLPHAAVWMYRYDYAMVPGDPLLGTAFHSAEIPFVFNNLDLLAGAGMPVNEEMRSVAECMQEAWTSFAKRGQPSTPSLPWPAYDAEERWTMVFGADSAVTRDPDADKRRMLTGESDKRTT